MGKVLICRLDCSQQTFSLDTELVMFRISCLSDWMKTRQDSVLFLFSDLGFNSLDLALLKRFPHYVRMQTADIVSCTFASGFPKRFGIFLGLFCCEVHVFLFS